MPLIQVYRLQNSRPPAPTRRTPRRIAKRRGKKAARGNPGGLCWLSTCSWSLNAALRHLGSLVGVEPDRVSDFGGNNFEPTIIGSQGRGHPKWRMRHAAFVQFEGIKSFF